MHAIVALLAVLLAACAAAPKVPVRPSRPWSEDIVYFVLVDRFADGDPTNDANVDRKAKGAFHGGDLKGLIANLDEIASLGVTAIWVNPLVKNVEGHVDGAGFPDWAYHGYWADDFTRLDPRFGTEEDLRRLVEACHARGIKVLLDVVYNHAGYDSRYLRDPKTRHWLRSNIVGDCGDDDLTSCLAGLPDFKTELPEVAKFLLDAQLGWAKRSGIDGFRLDTVKHVDHPFWQEHRKRTRAELGPDFFLLGEVWGGDADVLDPWFEPDELEAYAHLADTVDIRVAAGEEDTTLWGFRELIERGHVDVVQPDVTRCGGITELLRIARYASEHGQACVPHAWKSGIIKAASLHVNAVLPDALFQEYCVAETPLNTRLTRQTFPIRQDGFVDVPSAPGLGVDLDREVLERYAVGGRPLPVPV